MRVIRDRDEARWLPSRHHFALAKLIAMIVMKPASRAESSIKLIYAIDRDQSMVENYAVAMWLYVTGAAYLMAATHPAAWILMPWLAGFLIHAPCFLIGWIAGLFDAEDNRKLNGVLTMGMMLIASSYFATTTSPVRFIAWFFLSIMALNAIAAVVMWMLRGTAAAMERRCEA